MEYRKITLEQRISADVPSRDIPSFIEPLPPLVTNPFKRPKPVKGLQLFVEDSLCQEPELLQVYLRLKPCHIKSNLYEVQSEQSFITSTDTSTAGHGRRTQNNACKMYNFSHIFGPETSQKDIFETVVKNNLRKLVDGNSYTLLTYGASGSGKTYTLMGTVDAPGLVPRSLEYIFKIVDAAQLPLFKPCDGNAKKLHPDEQEYELQSVHNLRRVSAPLRNKYRRMSCRLTSEFSASTNDLSNTTRYYVWVSFIEIYNEAIYDVLDMGDRRTASKLRIREDAKGLVYVEGATQAFVRSGAEAYDVMVAGRHNLQVAATGVNAHSSRSHCVFTITMLTETGGGDVRVSTVRLCDLAGSERARRTHNTGARLAESRAINSSLHVLERCLHALQRRGSDAALRVPYRESKLTRLLGAGLSGMRGEAVSMVVTVNPDPACAMETKHVLQLAAIAKDIQVNNTIAESTLDSSTDVLQLRADNERLRFEMEQVLARNRRLMDSIKEIQEKNSRMMKEIVEEAKGFTKEFYEEQISSLEEKHQLEIEELTEEYECKLRAVTSQLEELKEKLQEEHKCKQCTVTTQDAQLTAQMAILEDKLDEATLARWRADQEIQYLRACIDERDNEKSGDSEAPNDQDAGDLSVSDIEEMSDDEMNESLEPNFKKEDLAVNKHKLSKLELSNLQDHESDVCLIDSANNTVQNLDISKDTVGDSNLTTNLKCENENELGQINDCLLANTLQDLKKDTCLAKNYDFDEKKDIECEIKNAYDGIKQGGDVKDKDISVFSKTLLDKIKKPDVKSARSDQSLAIFEQFEIEVDTAIKKKANLQNEPSEDFAKDILNKVAKVSSDKPDMKELSLNKEKVSVIDMGFPQKHKKNYFKDENSAETNKADETHSLQNKKYFDYDEYTSENVPTATGEVIKKENVFVKVKDNFSEDNVNSNFEECGNMEICREKKIFFDNIDIAEIKVSESKNTSNDLVDVIRSPSIVKEDVPSDYEPSTIKKLLADSIISNSHLPSTVNVKRSMDVFNDASSPELYTSNDKQPLSGSDNIVHNSMKRTPLVDDVTNEVPKHVNTEQNHIIPNDVLVGIKSENIKINTSEDTTSETNVTNKVNDTDIEFENIYKDVTVSRPTEFDLLVSYNNTDVLNESKKHEKPTNQEVSENKNYNIKYKHCVPTETKVEKGPLRFEPKTNIVIKQKSIEEEIKIVKYNLRHKTKSDEDKNRDGEKESENQLKCTKSATKAKRSLRLRRHKQLDEDSQDDTETLREKLKDIVNLQQEYSDVTMDIPPPQKQVEDMPSPEKKESEEYVAPMDSQSCFSKSVTRSRRKLFTPRPEPLEESLPQTGDSSERICVPRPSYHKGRARRKL